jgi:aspartyl protease family protein
LSEDSVSIIWGVVMLVILISALGARRMSFGAVVRGLISWAAIGLLAYIAVAHRHEIGAVFASVTARLGLDEQQTQGGMVRIRMSPDGHFYARVTVNGIERRMLIDSGATVTALSENTANTLEVKRSNDALPVMIETANGTISARRGRIERLDIGPLSTRDLGVVVSPAFGEMDVLGMNFLSRLKSWRVEGNVLVLDPGDPDAGGLGNSTR